MAVTETIIPWSVRLSWLENANSLPFFQRAILTRKVGQTDLVLACDQSLLVGLRVRDYKSLCAAVTIYSTLVNIQTHIHTHRQHYDQLLKLISKAQTAELIVSN